MEYIMQEVTNGGSSAENVWRGLGLTINQHKEERQENIFSGSSAKNVSLVFRVEVFCVQVAITLHIIH